MNNNPFITYITNTVTGEIKIFNNHENAMKYADHQNAASMARYNYQEWFVLATEERV